MLRKRAPVAVLGLRVLVAWAIHASIMVKVSHIISASRNASVASKVEPTVSAKEWKI